MRQAQVVDDSDRLSERNHVCSFDVGECWGYERFYELDCLLPDVGGFFVLFVFFGTYLLFLWVRVL